MKRRTQLRRVLKRDRRRCGVHLGGCGQPIQETKEYDIDYMIPRAFFSKVAGTNRSFYERDWNCQPTHLTCNQSKADGLVSWPQFQCTCPSLQIEDGHLFVWTRGRVGVGRHLLLHNVVSPTPDKVDARVVIGPGKLGGQKVQGASVGMTAVPLDLVSLSGTAGWIVGSARVGSWEADYPRLPIGYGFRKPVAIIVRNAS